MSGTRRCVEVHIDDFRTHTYNHDIQKSRLRLRVVLRADDRKAFTSDYSEPC
jgi:hypothetical protein